MLENILREINEEVSGCLKFSLKVVYKLRIPIVIATAALTYVEICLQNHPEAAKAFEEWSLYYFGH